MFLGFAAGVGRPGLFMLVAGALPGVPLAALLGAGVTVVIFLILSVHPVLLGRTPFGVVPAVLLGFVESLLWLMLDPMPAEGAPRPESEGRVRAPVAGPARLWRGGPGRA